VHVKSIVLATGM